jgi:hypothetical protein
MAVPTTASASRCSKPAAGGNGWAATFRDTSSAKLFACKIAAGQIACD